ncbi:MAG: DedA family protein [Prevotella sp.]|nr:DedA family protein [Prevotella sp.]
MNFITTLLSQLNYGTIFILMLLESTVIPVPSELVVAPAAYHAAGGNLNMWLVILFATLGADCGATINYLAGWYLGRPIIYRFANSKWGHACLLNQEKVEKSEKYFDDHGMVATITGRLLPGIRHLISIPAGLAKMTYWKFLLYTTIGAGAWNCILTLLGHYLHSFVPEDQLNNKIMEYGEYIKFGIMILVAAALMWFMAKWLIKRKKAIKDGIDPDKM